MIELVPLFTAVVDVAPPLAVSGGRSVGDLRSVTVQGERMTASLAGTAAADWMEVKGTVGSIDVRMTLTAAGCGMGTMIADEARNKMLGIPNVAEVEVELVWDPPWSRDMMSESAQLEMGLL